MFPTFALRSAELELIDGTDYSSEEFATGLSDLRRVNRYLGGKRALFRHLFPMIEAVRRPRVRLLDLGTGSADLPIAIVKWARKRGIIVDFVVMDLSDQAAHEARQLSVDYPEISTVQADALQPPFPAQSFDFVLASLFLHHFDTPAAARLIAAFAQIARVAVVINDLRRHPIAYYSIKVLTRIFRAGRLCQHDAALSVRRGFTNHDVDEISRLSGLPLKVFRHFPYRLMAIGLSGGTSHAHSASPSPVPAHPHAATPNRSD
ncbi:MAG: methyltransferase domain-containing protein [Acidobacteriota bacterium]